MNNPPFFQESVMAEGMFKSLRNFTLRSLTGHSVTFDRTKAVFVPASLRREALALGCVPEDINDIDTDQLEAELAAPVVIPPSLREALLFAVIGDIMEKESDKFKLFDAGGRPLPNVISSRVGFEVHVDERNRIVDAYREHKGLGTELPTHEAVADYREVLGLKARKDLQPFAELYGVNELFKNANLDEAKNIVLRAIVTPVNK
jgi:hypothetical protein